MGLEDGDGDVLHNRLDGILQALRTSLHLVRILIEFLHQRRSGVAGDHRMKTEADLCVFLQRPRMLCLRRYPGFDSLRPHRIIRPEIWECSQECFTTSSGRTSKRLCPGMVSPQGQFETLFAPMLPCERRQDECRLRIPALEAAEIGAKPRGERQEDFDLLLNASLALARGFLG